MHWQSSSSNSDTSSTYFQVSSESDSQSLSPLPKTTTTSIRTTTTDESDREQQGTSSSTSTSRFSRCSSSDLVISEDEIIDENLKRTCYLLPRVPVRCPIGNCDFAVGGSSMLIHFFYAHAPRIYHPIIHDSECCLIPFDPAIIYEKNYNYCLACLFYAGDIDGKPPYQRYVCLKNACTPGGGYEEFAHCMPVFLSVCKLPFDVLGIEIYQSDEDIYLFWCTSVNTAVPVQYNITIRDQNETYSYSKLTNLRFLSDSRDAKEILNDGRCLILTSKQVKELVVGERMPYLEVEILTIKLK